MERIKVKIVSVMWVGEVSKAAARSLEGGEAFLIQGPLGDIKMSDILTLDGDWAPGGVFRVKAVVREGKESLWDKLPAEAAKIAKELGLIEGDLVRDPYILFQKEIMSWDLTDEFARTQGIQVRDPRRINAAVLHAMRLVEAEGHTWVPLSYFQGDA